MTAAWELRDRDILLLEQWDRLGGRLYSEKRGPYWLNLGAHLFPGAGSHIRNMVATLGLEVIAIPGNKFAVWFAGKVYSPKSVAAMPFLLPLTLAERLSLARVGMTLLKAVRRWRAVAQPRPGETPARRRERAAQYMNEKSFRDLIGKPVGRVDALFSTAGRRAAVEIERQSAGVGASLFGAVWGGKASSMALNLSGGSGRLGEAVQKAVGHRTCLRSKVSEIVDEGDVVRVSIDTGAESKAVYARQAIVTVPAFVAAEIVRTIPKELVETLGKVQYGSFVSMGVITNETEPMPWDDVYAVTTPGAAFDMLFNHANPMRTGPRKPGGSLMVYAGGERAHKLMTLSEDEIRQAFLADLYKIYPQLQEILQETKIQKWSPGNSCRPVGFKFDAMLSYCERTDIRIQFAGDYFAEIGNMEVAASSAHEAAVRVRSQLVDQGQALHL
jgi:oxygen-dependent protoporphyrinogen oxidase